MITPKILYGTILLLMLIVVFYKAVQAATEFGRNPSISTFKEMIKKSYQDAIRFELLKYIVSGVIFLIFLLILLVGPFLLH